MQKTPPFLQFKLLKDFSTFGIGGEARYFTEVRDAQEMSSVLSYCYSKKLPFFILGKGSNTLFDDRGFDGLVILNKIDFLERDEGKFRVGSGYSFSRLGQVTAKLGFSGLEFAAAIPATVGGAIFMNAGANGQECFDCLEELSFVTEEGEVLRLLRKNLSWGYRSSSLHQKKGAIIEATFLLSPFEQAKEKQKKIIEYRLQTQPYGEKSCGCIFQNPPGESAGRLIEESGLKGLCLNGAAVSEQHANFIVNRGGATKEDVLALIQRIKEGVYKEKGIMLQEEIRVVPYGRDIF